MADSILSIRQLTKTYQSGDRPLTVLDDISFDLTPGSTNAIVGPSGSGKTTLLGLAAGLDRPTSGQVLINDQEVSNMTEDQLADFRNEYVGFIFQTFQLLPTLTAIENVMIPLELQGKRDGYDLAAELLRKVGLGKRLTHYPTQLSGGEQQRVALARAFIHQPVILFADEPTGNLDEETSQTVEELLFSLNSESGTTLVIVTHDLELARKTQRTIRLKGGKVASDEWTTPKHNGTPLSQEIESQNQ
ncbi:MAG: ABC transporter ATP-binding protein [Bacteroidota bacterium]